MAKVLVLYHSTYGHVEAHGRGCRRRRSIHGRHGGLAPACPATAGGSRPEIRLQVGPGRADRDGAGASDYDAIVVGVGTRYGRMPSQMANFLEQTGGLWARGALNGKVGAAFSSTATQHGGQETTLFSVITNLLHLGMLVVGLSYSFVGQTTLEEITGGSPYGATTIAGGKAQRMPSANELDGARFQGRLVAETARKLHG
jgi:NAD(P)H dehydrogenase (quinone)